MSDQQPERTKCEPQSVWYRGLFSGEFSVRGTVEEISKWKGAIEFGVRLENGNFVWAMPDQIKDRAE